MYKGFSCFITLAAGTVDVVHYELVPDTIHDELSSVLLSGYTCLSNEEIRRHCAFREGPKKLIFHILKCFHSEAAFVHVFYSFEFSLFGLSKDFLLGTQ
jgi:hypothetical protein